MSTRSASRVSQVSMAVCMAPLALPEEVAIFQSLRILKRSLYLLRGKRAKMTICMLEDPIVLPYHLDPHLRSAFLKIALQHGHHLALIAHYSSHSATNWPILLLLRQLTRLPQPNLRHVLHMLRKKTQEILRPSRYPFRESDRRHQRLATALD